MTATRPARWFSGLCLLAVFASAGEARAGGASPLFDEVDGALSNGCGGVGCWTNYLRVSDLDGDADLDVVLVNYDGFFQAGQAQELVIYENEGGSFTDVSQSAVGGFEGRTRQVAIGDVDGDGSVDIFVPNARGSGSAFFMNTGDMVFVDEYETRMPAAQSDVGAARFGDFDNDGDLDIFASDGYLSSPTSYGHVYLNDGLGVFTELAGAIPDGFGGQDPDDVDLLDANGDFVLDIVLNAHSGDNSLWFGNGDGTFADASDQFPGQPNTYHYNPGVCDVDGDGDLDVWIDNMGPGYSEQLLINDGTGTFEDQTSDRVTGNPAQADDNGVICADIDLDGDFDAVVIALSTRERYLINDGSGNFTYVPGAFGGSTDASLWGEFGDLDGDGRFDLVTGQGEFGDIEDHVYFANAAVAVDDRAPDFRAVDAGPFPAAAALVVRSAIVDRSVTDEGPRLSSVTATLTGDGVEEDTAVTFMGGDLFRAQFPAQAVGEYTVEFCATDMAGNEGCETTEVSVAEEGGETGDTDTDAGTDTGADGSSGGVTDSESTTGSSTASDTNATASMSETNVTATASASETDGSDTQGDTEGDSAGGSGGGGGCRSGGPVPLTLLLLGPGLLGLRRRRDPLQRRVSRR